MILSLLVGNVERTEAGFSEGLTKKMEIFEPEESIESR
jgi:hypothetical protein